MPRLARLPRTPRFSRTSGLNLLWSTGLSLEGPIELAWRGALNSPICNDRPGCDDDCGSAPVLVVELLPILSGFLLHL